MPPPAGSGLNAAPASFQIVSRCNRMVRIQYGVWIASGSADDRLKPREGRHRAISRLGVGRQPNQDRSQNAPDGGLARGYHRDPRDAGGPAGLRLGQDLATHPEYLWIAVLHGAARICRM